MLNHVSLSQTRARERVEEGLNSVYLELQDRCLNLECDMEALKKEQGVLRLRAEDLMSQVSEFHQKQCISAFTSSSSYGAEGNMSLRSLDSELGIKESYDAAHELSQGDNDNDHHTTPPVPIVHIAGSITFESVGELLANTPPSLCNEDHLTDSSSENGAPVLGSVLVWNTETCLGSSLSNARIALHMLTGVLFVCT